MLPLSLQLVWALCCLFTAVGVCAALHTAARVDVAPFSAVSVGVMLPFYCCWSMCCPLHCYYRRCCPVNCNCRGNCLLCLVRVDTALLLLLVWTLTLYTAVSVYAAYIYRLGWVLRFLFCGRRRCLFMMLLAWALLFILLFDGDEAFYLAVCGNTNIYTTYIRGAAAIVLPPSILDASSPVPAPSLAPFCCPLPSGVIRRRCYLLAQCAAVNPLPPRALRIRPVFSFSLYRLETEGSCRGGV